MKIYNYSRDETDLIPSFLIRPVREAVKDLDKIISRDASLRKGADEFHAEGLEFMRHFFMEQKMKWTIHTTTADTDLTHICSAFALGLTSSVGMGVDPAEARRLWLLGFAKLAGVREGRK